MKLLVPYGLRGVEVYYPFHDKELIVRYENFAAENSLLKTGGTDWHGQDFTTWNVEIGDFGIKESPQSIESYFI
jgi:predicted metal-dependent phosphoesterase TrpH